MAEGLLRVGIVGASSLLGKELAEELAESELGVVDVILLDEDVEGAQVTAVGDEASLIQPMGPESFEGMAICFFAGSAETTRRHWKIAAGAGVKVVDLSNALAVEEGVTVRSPWAEGQGRFGLGTVAMAPAHPVAGMVGLLARRCAAIGLRAIAATVMEPASERGAAGMDEMHRQTVRLLSFQSVPKAEFDAQVAFNLLAELGPGAQTSMESVGRRIEADYVASTGGGLADLSVQMVHVPVFHGYAVSVLLDFAGDVTVEVVRGALAGEHLEIVQAGEEAPSNLNATGQGKILARLSEGGAGRIWVWMTADNLKVRALQAIACAMEWQAIRVTETIHHPRRQGSRLQTS